MSVETAVAERVAGRGAPAAPVVSVVTPAFNEDKNLPLLHARLERVLADLGVAWEWVIVDDHSADRTFAVASEIAARDPRVRVFRFAHNSGSHLALAFGLRQTAGACSVVMAADLQDPPETLPSLIDAWQAGTQVVWAVRRVREGESTSTLAFSRLYWTMMRRVVGLSTMPAAGADFFLLDRRVVDAIRHCPERNVSLMGLIAWMGFRQTEIAYDKQARVHGRSGWNLKKKLKLVADSVTAFSDVPVRLMSYGGAALTAIGLAVGAGAVVAGALGAAWGLVAIAALVLVLAGLQMLVMGVLGEYVWRALDEARRRPAFVIEAATGAPRSGDV